MKTKNLCPVAVLKCLKFVIATNGLVEENLTLETIASIERTAIEHLEADPDREDSREWKDVMVLIETFFDHPHA